MPLDKIENIEEYVKTHESLVLHIKNNPVGCIIEENNEALNPEQYKQQRALEEKLKAETEARQKAQQEAQAQAQERKKAEEKVAAEANSRQELQKKAEYFSKAVAKAGCRRPGAQPGKSTMIANHPPG